MPIRWTLILALCAQGAMAAPATPACTKLEVSHDEGPDDDGSVQLNLRPDDRVSVKAWGATVCVDSIVHDYSRGYGPAEPVKTINIAVTWGKRSVVYPVPARYFGKPVPQLMLEPGNALPFAIVLRNFDPRKGALGITLLKAAAVCVQSLEAGASTSACVNDGCHMSAAMAAEVETSGWPTACLHVACALDSKVAECSPAALDLAHGLSGGKPRDVRIAFRVASSANTQGKASSHEAFGGEIAPLPDDPPGRHRVTAQLPHEPSQNFGIDISIDAKDLIKRVFPVSITIVMSEADNAQQRVAVIKKILDAMLPEDRVAIVPPSKEAPVFSGAFTTAEGKAKALAYASAAHDGAPWHLGEQLAAAPALLDPTRSSFKTNRIVLVGGFQHQDKRSKAELDAVVALVTRFATEGTTLSLFETAPLGEHGLMTSLQSAGKGGSNWLGYTQRVDCDDTFFGRRFPLAKNLVVLVKGATSNCTVNSGNRMEAPEKRHSGPAASQLAAWPDMQAVDHLYASIRCEAPQYQDFRRQPRATPPAGYDFTLLWDDIDAPDVPVKTK